MARCLGVPSARVAARGQCPRIVDQPSIAETAGVGERLDGGVERVHFPTGGLSGVGLDASRGSHSRPARALLRYERLFIARPWVQCPGRPDRR